jgi:hypothetical protein
MTAVDKAALFVNRLPQEDVEVPGVGTVRVRSLSRAEVMALQGTERPTPLELERKFLVTCLVDPVLTEDEVRQWQEASSAGEIEPVTRVISRLSGMDEKAAKEAVKRFRG